MLYMIIEHYRGRNGKAVYERYEKKGRMLPDRLKYVSSWTEINFDRCFQLMETDDRTLFDEWISNWNDLVDFEIVPVMTATEAAGKASRA